jgi:hypothetical protein
MAVPYTTPIPGAPQQGMAANQAKLAYQRALARINQRRNQTLRQAGYLGDIDPESGTIQNLRVDPLNQYGGLQSMLRGQAQRGEQMRFAAQERGLHGGLAHKGESELSYESGREAAEFGQGLTGALGGLQDEQSQAKEAQDAALYEAQLEDARNAIQDQNFNPADFTGLDYPAYGEDPFGSGVKQPPYTYGGVPRPKPKPKPNSRQKLINRMTQRRQAQLKKGRRR